jgi:hypothetical protein
LGVDEERQAEEPVLSADDPGDGSDAAPIAGGGATPKAICFFLAKVSSRVAEVPSESWLELKVA